MKKLLLLLTYSVLLAGTVTAQTKTGLQVGDKAPSLVVQTTVNTIQSFGFPYKNKMVLIYFWSSAVPASTENLYDISKINKLYARSAYRQNDGFEIISVAVQADRSQWNKDIAKYNMLTMTNCIASKGFDDFFIKQYQLSSVPASFLIDEFGKIVSINPDVPTICDYLNNKKNIPDNADVQNRISGKIMYGDNGVQPLKNRKIYLTNKENDTIQTVQTNSAGSFSINNVNAESAVSLKIAKTEEIGDNDKVFLASEKGEIVSGFKKSGQGFEYRLLPLDMAFLKPLKEAEPELKMAKNSADMFFSENIFKSGGNTITPAAAKKLDALVDKLRVNSGLVVNITAHTDSRGDANANMSLSVKRANAVAAYFVSKGIDKSRITSEGKGETEPVNGCVDGVNCDDGMYEENRRIEFKFHKTE